jgi:phospholipid/cholesterol/gamma-HCH transport system ATP-binding protein
VSHDVVETAAIADYIYVISDGKIMARGTSAEIFANETAQVKQFIHGLADGVVPFHYPANKFAEDLELC